ESYTKLMGEIGARRVDHNWSGQSGVRFSIGIEGATLVDYFETGIVHTERRPKAIVEEPTPWESLPDNTEEFLELEDGWYIYRLHE
ncbi:MAG: hypothetical protein AAF517_20975, partial [Planctomycetota bacterium]